MANTYLTRTPSSTGNRKILTISCWFKRGNVDSTQTLFANGGNSYNRDYISLESKRKPLDFLQNFSSFLGQSFRFRSQSS